MADGSQTAHASGLLEDPRALAVSRLYATSLLNAAGADASAVLDEFRSFVDMALRGNAEFGALIFSGVLGHDELTGIIDRVVAPRASTVFTNFLKVVSRHDRFTLLPGILEAAQLEYEKRCGQQRVQVISARPLDSGAADRIRDRLRKTFSFEPILEQQTDPKLIGGLVLRIGNTVYDGSLRSRLNQLAKQMQQRSLHEIQSGRNRFSHPEGD